MKSPSFNFYPNNWLASSRIAAMLPEQEGAYTRLLCYQWNSEDQTIPNDDKTLAAMSRLNERWETMGMSVKSCFKPMDGDPRKLRNERLWHEFTRIDRLREKNAEAGRKGMRKRWGGKKLKRTDADDNVVITPLLPPYNGEQRTESREHGGLNSDINPPQPPSREGGVPSPEKKKKKPPLRVSENSPLMGRLGKLFGRKPTTLWTTAEAERLEALEPDENEVSAIEEYYYARVDPKTDYRRRDLITLLNNWRGELDRAAKHFQLPARRHEDNI